MREEGRKKSRGEEGFSKIEVKRIPHSYIRLQNCVEIHASICKVKQEGDITFPRETNRGIAETIPNRWSLNWRKTRIFNSTLLSSLPLFLPRITHISKWCFTLQYFVKRIRISWLWLPGEIATLRRTPWNASSEYYPGHKVTLIREREQRALLHRDKVHLSP